MHTRANITNIAPQLNKCFMLCLQYYRTKIIKLICVIPRQILLYSGKSVWVDKGLDVYGHCFEWMRNGGMNKQLNKETLGECGREYVRPNVKYSRYIEINFFYSTPYVRTGKYLMFMHASRTRRKTFCLKNCSSNKYDVFSHWLRTYSAMDEKGPRSWARW